MTACQNSDQAVVFPVTLWWRSTKLNGMLLLKFIKENFELYHWVLWVIIPTFRFKSLGNGKFCLWRVTTYYAMVAIWNKFCSSSVNRIEIAGLKGTIHLFGSFWSSVVLMFGWSKVCGLNLPLESTATTALLVLQCQKLCTPV